MEENISSNENHINKGKFILMLTGLIFLGAIIIISILRDRIVNHNQNQVTVMGQGKVEYRPTEAEVTLGMRVDKVAKADDALNQLNDKMNKIISALSDIGISKDDVRTQNYSLFPQYDYNNGTTNISGYNATEQIIIKVKNIDKNPDLVGKAIAASSSAGANDVSGVQYYTPDLNDLKQQARLKAIEDAKSKSESLFSAVGITGRPRVVGWYETNVSVPPMPLRDGMGGATPLGMGMAESKTVSQPEVPSGSQEITVEIGLNYQIN